MSFPTEQQVEAVAHALYGLNLDSWEDIVEATRIALTALAPEWREMERDALRYRWLRKAREHWGVLMREDDESNWIDLHGNDLDAEIDAAREREG